MSRHRFTAPAWYALDGARKYINCRKNKKAERAAFLEKCKVCPSSVLGSIPGLGYALYCGPKLQDRMKEPLPTCGCPVGFLRAHLATAVGIFRGMIPEDEKRIVLTILKPAGRATCCDHPCPQGR